MTGKGNDPRNDIGNMVSKTKNSKYGQHHKLDDDVTEVDKDNRRLVIVN